MKRLLIIQIIMIAGVFSSVAAYSQPEHNGFQGAEKMELILKLSEESRTLLQYRVEEFREINEPLLEDITIAKENLKSILSAADFDQEAFRNEASHLQELLGALMSEKLQMFGEVAAELPHEDREILAQLLPGRQAHHFDNF